MEASSDFTGMPMTVKVLQCASDREANCSQPRWQSIQIRNALAANLMIDGPFSKASTVNFVQFVCRPTMYVKGFLQQVMSGL